MDVCHLLSVNRYPLSNRWHIEKIADIILVTIFLRQT